MRLFAPFFFFFYFLIVLVAFFLIVNDEEWTACMRFGSGTDASWWGDITGGVDGDDCKRCVLK